jgi:hypothetical protein
VDLNYLEGIPCGGVLEYLHRSPAIRSRRRKENPCLGVKVGRPITGGHKYCDLVPGGGLDARIMTLRCKNIIVAKSEEVKPGSSVVESSKES